MNPHGKISLSLLFLMLLIGSATWMVQPRSAAAVQENLATELKAIRTELARQRQESAAGTYTPTPTPSLTPNATASPTPSFTPTFTVTATPEIPQTISQTLGSLTPTPVNTPAAGYKSHLVVLSSGNSGAVAGALRIALNGTIVYNLPIGATGTQNLAQSVTFWDYSGNATWGFIPPSSATVTQLSNYKFLYQAFGQPLP